MCGIFGHIGNIPQELAVVCTDSLAHRGPDGSDIWQREGITLGHRRLAILDLTEHGKQPMSYVNGRYWITYNGELYNFLEIREELQKKGHKFQSDSDTEVILASFAEWGASCLDKFNGMWAFAILDSREKSLFLSRDRFGIKPLFYSFLPYGFAFASEMKALFPFLGQVRPNISLVKDSRKIFRYEATYECIIKGIKRFTASTYGWYKSGKLQLSRYWCTLDHLVQVPMRYEEQVEQFQGLFNDACKVRMRSDVSIGTALSGGFDSSSTISAVAYIAKTSQNSPQSRDWQHAFVAAFPGTPLDESKYAKMITDHLGIEATSPLLEMDPLKAVDKLDDYFYLFEDLYITSPIPFMLTYDAMKDQGVKVIIDGHGADECFAGYPSNYLFALFDAKLSVRLSCMILDTLYCSYPKNSSQLNLPPKFQYWLKWYVTQILQKILGRKRLHWGDSNHPAWKTLDHLTRQLYLSTHDTILPTLLRNYDRYSMANGVEIRMPFMDYRLITYAFSLPWTSKIRNGFSKAIIRDGIAPFMPKEVAYRKSKIGFNSPIVDWMKGPMKDFSLDIIRSQAFKDCVLIDSRKTTDIIKKVISNPKASFQDGEKAWTMLMPYFWERAVVKRNDKAQQLTYD
jgi:asparagine synthase (glutamine-hydrolysing)